MQNARLLTPHVPLAGWANGDQMVYAVNPAYLEIGQGSTSPMRGWGAIVFAFMTVFTVYMFIATCFDVYNDFQRMGWEAMELDPIFSILFALFAAGLGLVVGGFYLVTSFLSVTDVIVRLDRKRQKVWMWTGKGPIEISWSDLVPRIEYSVASAYATVKSYRGQYVELGPNGTIRTTNGIPHIFQCGQISAAEEGVTPSMEYVRLYMESGPHAVPKPEKLLSHRPRWYAMVNLFGVADDWVRWSENRDKPGIAPAPWTRTVIGLLFFPIFFPMQITNWLALMVSPKPKWPKELELMHESDLAQAAQVKPSETVERHKRKPVIRINGIVVSGGNEDSQ